MDPQANGQGKGMHLTVLSEFSPTEQHVGTAAGLDLRQTLADSCDVTFLQIRANSHAQILPGLRINDRRFPRLRRLRHRVFNNNF